MADPDDPDSLDDNDPALMQAAVGPVRRLHAEPAIERPRPAAQARQRQLDEREALRISQHTPFTAGAAGESSLYRRPEIPERTLRRLRRGLYAVQDEIDLHGLHASDAETLLRRFLAEARAAEAGCVRIVHGKGLHGKADGPVLRPLIERLLVQRADVLAFSSAPPAQGGTGALLVLLARRRPGLGAVGDD